MVYNNPNVTSGITRETMKELYKLPHVKIVKDASMEPKTLKALQDAYNFTELMVRQEELKTMPFGAVWEEYLRRETVPQDYFAEIKRYEADVLSKR